MALTQVRSDGIATGAVTATQIAANAVTVDDISDGSISTAKLAADCVDGTKIADDAINSEHYVDGSIDTAHIADAQVTTAKLADANVTTAKIADDAVTADKLADTAVTAGSYGDASNIPSITVDAQGRVTAASSNAINVQSDQIFEGNTNVECVDTGSDGHIMFDTEGTERWRIDSTGLLDARDSTGIKVNDLYNSSNNLVLAGFTRTVYVSDSGNDSTGDGTSSSPWRSMQKAFNSCQYLFGNHSYTIRVQGTSFTMPGYASLYGADGAASHYYWHSGGITIQADSGTITWNCNGNGMTFHSVRVPIRFKNINFVGASGTWISSQIDVQDCSSFFMYDSCSWTMNATSGGGNWSVLNGCGFHRCRYVFWGADITLNSAVTAGYGGLFKFNNCGYVDLSGVDAVKNGTRYGQACFAATNGTVLSHTGTIDNFDQAIRGGIDHYGAEGGARIIIGGTYRNCNTGIYGYHDTHIRTYSTTYSGNSSNLSTDSTSSSN